MQKWKKKTWKKEEKHWIFEDFKWEKTLRTNKSVEDGWRKNDSTWLDLTRFSLVWFGLTLLYLCQMKKFSSALDYFTRLIAHKKWHQTTIRRRHRFFSLFQLYLDCERMTENKKIAWSKIESREIEVFFSTWYIICI